MAALATWQGLHGEASWLVCIVMLLCVILGEMVALRKYAEAHWDDLHGPVRETLRGAVNFDRFDIRPGSTVNFDGKEFRVQQVTHEIAMGASAGDTTSFEATRGEDRA
jgi:hypothetical protein